MVMMIADFILGRKDGGCPLFWPGAKYRADVEQYREFTSRASNSLQTWVAIGGWSFSDPGATRTAWTDMVSTEMSRSTFIDSLVAFMTQYGFTGTDLDWEYPETESRGGRKGDAGNLVHLVKEMPAVFGSKFGISVTLAPDYWYLRGFKPKEMELSRNIALTNYLLLTCRW
ncbi:hypothetical protein PG993_005800 [Apiospora rasikravindrae]|uniref:GH18 domain-containing protein n=1 Tax=Apiospora rasikravindrae TaxID=990691 RepID=A0ABR1TBL2_9PEZI